MVMTCSSLRMAVLRPRSASYIRWAQSSRLALASWLAMVVISRARSLTVLCSDDMRPRSMGEGAREVIKVCLADRPPRNVGPNETPAAQPP